MFYLKKIISSFLSPVPLVILLLSLALYLLWRTQRQRAAKCLLAAALLILLISGFSPFPDLLLKATERSIPPYDRAVEGRAKGGHADYVVVLGGGHVYDPGLPITSRPSHSSLTRLIEGIRIKGLNPESRLVLSGGGMSGRLSDTEAESMAAVARAMGLDEDSIIIEEGSLDTGDQARLIKSIVGESDFVLVTSASHMPRALALFRAKGMHPLPAPTDYMAKEGEVTHPGNYIPGAEGLKKTEVLIHEYVGLLWSALKGQI